MIFYKSTKNEGGVVLVRLNEGRNISASLSQIDGIVKDVSIQSVKVAEANAVDALEDEEVYLSPSGLT